MRIINLRPWVFYIEGKPQFDEHKVGKWMYFFKDKERVAGLCKAAVEQGIVLEAKHSDAPDGVSCFYLECDDMESHKKVIQFFLDNDMIQKIKTGKLYNISFKLDDQTRAGEYGEMFQSEIKLEQFLDLYTGEWIDELGGIRVCRESDYLFVMRDYLVEHGMKYDETIDNKVMARKDGKTYGFSEHLQAMVYSLLSAQRPWAEVVKHLDEIDGIFFDYDAKKILEQTDTYFVDRIREIKCGNRNIHDQMKYLPDNIATLRSIEREYGSLDAFVISAPAHEIVKTLADYKSKYKLRNMGEALCWEYLRNVGIDGAKPDVHLRRFLGSERMGTGNHETATVSEVIDTVRRLSRESGLSMAAIDNIIWSFCSEQYGEICGASPKCRECPVKEHCHKK